MSARVLDGKATAAEVTELLREQVGDLVRKPGLAVILVGDDPASAVYVRNKTRMAERIGFHHEQVGMPASSTEEEVLAQVARLNEDPRVDGILVQLPLPKHIDKTRVLDAIRPDKDADCFHPHNVGLFSQGRARVIPCTPAGVMELLRRTEVPLRGKDAVVIGRSDIVGRPMARLLEGVDCTVTLTHSRTVDLAGHLRRADVIIAAVGIRALVKAEHVKPGAIVIDVGMNHDDNGKLCGDVDYAGVSEVAGWITPVPGGVGPMTIAMLMKNTFNLANARG